MTDASNQNTQNPEEFSFAKYVAGIMSKLKLDNAPKEMKQKVEEAVVDRLNTRIIGTVVSAMTESDVDRFEALVAENAENKEVSSLEALYEASLQMPQLYDALMTELKNFEEDLLFDIKRMEQFKQEEE